ncbi:hypothetical protein KR032_004981 [Drosophila birchii]|nr:hypothetical protein KR032_004981 [Drosophila birchii]
MVSCGCIAKVLKGLECRSNVWIKTVNPGWYTAREIPKAMLTEKALQAAQAIRDKAKIAESAQKAGTPMNMPYF